MSDSEDDWETQDAPVVLNKKAVVDEEEDLTVAEMAAEEAQKMALEAAAAAWGGAGAGRERALGRARRDGHDQAHPE